VSAKSYFRTASVAFILFAFASVQFSVSAQDKTNPVKPSPESLAKGKKTYNIDCAMCHNANGDGKNDMDIKNVPDLTDPGIQSKATDGQWFEVLQKGTGDMPPEGPRAKNNDDLWNLVNYCRSLKK
jgi:mono/diheme cytochrome c family protein